MTEKLIELLGSVPHPLAVSVIAMVPIGELRASIPLGLFTYHLDAFTTYFFSIVGNLIPIVFILLFLEKTDRFLRQRSRTFAAFFDWLYRRTYKRGGEQFKKWGALALIIFVAIPLPVTGAWTGAVLATLFEVPFKKAFPLIAIGVIIAGIVVTLLSLTAGGIF